MFSQTISLAEVTAGVRHELRLRAIACDAVKHLVLCAIEQRPPKPDLENYPHLPVLLPIDSLLCRAPDALFVGNFLVEK